MDYVLTLALSLEVVSQQTMIELPPPCKMFEISNKSSSYLGR